MYVRKSDIVRSAVKDQDWKKALKIAKGFRLGISREQNELITRAYECMVHPGFYMQIGVVPEESIEKGVILLKRLYG